MRMFAVLLGLLLLPSCFVSRSVENEPLSLTRVDQLEPGVTTARQAVELMGAPIDIVQLGKRSAYLYRHTAQKRSGLLLVVVGLFHEDTRSDFVWLFFDENELLSHVGSTFASHRVQYGMPWNELHDPDDMAADDAERRSIEEEYVRRSAGK